MKSLEFKMKPSFGEAQVEETLHSIGQEPHNLPDVFSFFLPEFQPDGELEYYMFCFCVAVTNKCITLLAGPIGSAGLVSPETEALTGPYIVNLVNGLLSLVKYGLDSAYGMLHEMWLLCHCKNHLTTNLYSFIHTTGGFADENLGQSTRTLGSAEGALGSNMYFPSSELDSMEVINELATLLTSGRLSQEKRDLLLSVFENTSGSTLEKVINVQQLILTSPEFHSNGLSRNKEDIRTIPSLEGTGTGNYKALINLFLTGGVDSFNVLVPHQCSGTNEEGTTVDVQYKTIRGELALTPSESNLQIKVDSADGQPCSSFIIHPDLPIAKELYDEGSLLFFANTGQVDTSQMTPQNYRQVAVSSLFGHNTMQREARLNDPFRTDAGTGPLGRLSEVLTVQGYSTSGISIDSTADSLTPDSTTDAPRPFVVSQDGPTEFAARPQAEVDFPIEELAEQFNSATDLYSNMFGETWSSAYVTGTRQANQLSQVLEGTSLTQEWGRGHYNPGLQMISRLIQTRNNRGVDRDVFFFGGGNWDHHGTMKDALSAWLTRLNESLTSFVAELKSMGVWDDVVIVVNSEFGRTLTKNGADGTDHGWGGNYFIMGGGVRGGHILGKYPSDLTSKGPATLDERSRFMPTTSWESVWHGIHEWMGVNDRQDMLEILPNLEQAYGNGFTPPFQQEDLFKT
jgi:uncharacterized protein (DUF1501 family)